jgi:hypothetical protein
MDDSVFPGIRCGPGHASMIRERGGGLGRALTAGLADRWRGMAGRRSWECDEEAFEHGGMMDSGRRRMDWGHCGGEAFKRRQHDGLRAAWNGLQPRRGGEAFELWPSWIQMRWLPGERERDVVGAHAVGYGLQGGAGARAAEQAGGVAGAHAVDRSGATGSDAIMDGQEREGAADSVRSGGTGYREHQGR